MTLWEGCDLGTFILRRTIRIPQRPTTLKRAILSLCIAFVALHQLVGQTCDVTITSGPANVNFNNTNGETICLDGTFDVTSLNLNNGNSMNLVVLDGSNINFATTLSINSQNFDFTLQVDGTATLLGLGFNTNDANIRVGKQGDLTIQNSFSANTTITDPLVFDVDSAGILTFDNDVSISNASINIGLNAKIYGQNLTLNGGVQVSNDGLLELTDKLTFQGTGVQTDNGCGQSIIRAQDIEFASGPQGITVNNAGLIEATRDLLVNTNPGAVVNMGQGSKVKFGRNFTSSTPNGFDYTGAPGECAQIINGNTGNLQINQNLTADSEVYWCGDLSGDPVQLARMQTATFDCGCTSDTIACPVNPPLPVVWLSFNAEVSVESSASVSWVTASEEGASHYELYQQQPDGLVVFIASVPAVGQSTTPMGYQYGVDGLEAGIHLFQIKQVDLDGAFEWTEWRQVSIGAPVGVAVGPNPVSVGGTLGLQGTSLTHYLIHSITGQVVLSGELEPSVTHQDISLPAAMSSGFYLLRVSDGQTWYSVKLYVE